MLSMYMRRLNSRCLFKQTFINSPRFINNGNEPPDKKYTRENVQKTVKGYMFTRFFDYVQNYDKILEKKFPSAVSIYRVFLSGVKDFYSDMKTFLKVTRIQHGSALGLRSLTRKEIELYFQMPKDMFKVAPVLILSTLPFANYVIFPLAYMYPRVLLTQHFWSADQRSEFNQFYLKDRLTYTRKVFRCLQAKLELIKPENKNHSKWVYILGLLGSGVHPTSEEILLVRRIFTEYPYHLDSLSSKHVNYLCHLHGIHRGWLRRARLAERSYLVHHMDLAIKREGGVHNMATEALRKSCFIRGLNPTNLSNDKMISWLEEWVKVSLFVDGTNISLLLHLPILIGYNHPNNWEVVYNK